MNTSTNGFSLSLDNTEVRHEIREWSPGQKRTRFLKSIYVWSEGRFSTATVFVKEGR